MRFGPSFIQDYLNRFYSANGLLQSEIDEFYVFTFGELNSSENDKHSNYGKWPIFVKKILIKH